MSHANQLTTETIAGAPLRPNGERAPRLFGRVALAMLSSVLLFTAACACGEDKTLSSEPSEPSHVVTPEGDVIVLQALDAALAAETLKSTPSAEPPPTVLVDHEQNALILIGERRTVLRWKRRLRELESAATAFQGDRAHDDTSPYDR